MYYKEHSGQTFERKNDIISIYRCSIYFNIIRLMIFPCLRNKNQYISLKDINIEMSPKKVFSFSLLVFLSYFFLLLFPIYQIKMWEQTNKINLLKKYIVGYKNKIWTLLCYFLEECLFHADRNMFLFISDVLLGTRKEKFCLWWFLNNFQWELFSQWINIFYWFFLFLQYLQESSIHTLTYTNFVANLKSHWGYCLMSLKGNRGTLINIVWSFFSVCI